MRREPNWRSVFTKATTAGAFMIALTAVFFTGCQPSSTIPTEPALETDSPKATEAPLPTSERPADSPKLSPTPSSQEGSPRNQTPGATIEDGQLLSTRPTNPEDIVIDLARQHLAAYLSIPLETTKIVEVEAVLWPDGSLDCPLPGFAYTQAVVDGYRIELSVGDDTYTYHADDRSRVILCQNGQPILPDLPINPGDIDDGQPWVPVD